MSLMSKGKVWSIRGHICNFLNCSQRLRNEEDMAPQSLGGQNKTRTHKLTLQNKTKNIQDIITSKMPSIIKYTMIIQNVYA